MRARTARAVLAAPIVLLVAALAVVPSSADPLAANALRGFPPSFIAAELAAERVANASPTAAVAMRDELALAGHVHRMGQPGDYETAAYVRNRLAADGFDAKIVTYDVPIIYPVEQNLQLVSPVNAAVDLYEPAVPGDPYSRNHAAIAKPYSGFSADGDASGPLVYANYGSAQDFARLAKLGINLRGAIVLVKSGHGAAERKGRRVVAYGGKALLLYTEPAYNPYAKAGLKYLPYPAGPARPLGAAMRQTLVVEYDPGDPLAIGIPVPGALQHPLSTLKVAPIPISAITGTVAAQLEAHLGGPLAPQAWATRLTPNVRLGGVERVHYVLRSKRFIGPMWDVIATMRGASSQESVVIGGHRDAWTYGAVDPISGTVAMLQVADAFKQLRATGWRPFRTVIIGSWDGEELNDFGSAIWVDQHAARLRARCWAYINTDEVAFGPQFEAGATDDLVDLVRAVSAAARAPGGGTIEAYWSKQDPRLAVDPSGSGSDHEPFTYHEGIPMAGIDFGGSFGTYHSAYDDPASLRIFDPGMRYAQAAARYYAVMMLRLADAPYPDIRLSMLAQALQRRLNAFANAPGNEARRIAVVRALEPQIARFAQLGSSIDSSADESTSSGNLAALARLRSLSFSIRAKLYLPAGVVGDAWQGSIVYNPDDAVSTLPTLEMTLDPKEGDRALRQLVGTFQGLPPLLVI